MTSLIHQLYALALHLSAAQLVGAGQYIWDGGRRMEWRAWAPRCAVGLAVDATPQRRLRANFSPQARCESECGARERAASC
jgi:hypothetical protein